MERVGETGSEQINCLNISPLPGPLPEGEGIHILTCRSRYPRSPLRNDYNWLGRQDYSSLRASPLRGRCRCATTFKCAAHTCRTLRFSSCRILRQCSSLRNDYNWLGRQDSNLRIRGSKPRALPLGDVPNNLLVTHPYGTVSCSLHCGQQGRAIGTPRHKA
jgi:hypothetical protein